MIKGHPILEQLAFREENGLCYTIADAENNAERLYMHDAAKLGVDAVYFRRFYRKDSEQKSYHSEPAVCILKREQGFFDSEEHHQLHAALWSAGRVEIYIIYSATRIDIINARRPAKRVGEDKLEISVNDEELTLVSEAIEAFDNRRFVAHLFDSGTFWEQPDFKDRIDGNNSPYAFLSEYLSVARNKITKQEILLDATLDKLLIICLLIKILEEIKDDNGKHTLKSIYSKYDIKSFIEGLQKGKLINILEELSGEFNGGVFNTFSSEENDKIQQANLTPLTYFISADINLSTNQKFIWKQYDFRHLPAEVISAIYEDFIQAAYIREEGAKQKGVVYTPLHLVNLLIDETMPLDEPELFEDKKFRVLDPACGSGVFLVAAYKRMLQWWAINEYKKHNVVIYPDRKIAQEILEDNIFGVDIEETAVLVSIFGLTIALLDKLRPKEIWNELKFKNLKEENITYGNFKDWATKAKKQEEKFDLVIGNPPFNPSKKGTITKEECKELFGVEVPRDKLELKFLEGAFYFGYKVCLIVRSSGLLYDKSKPSRNYRHTLFTERTVNKIYDFTHLREQLFIKKTKKGIAGNKKTGRTPVLALIAENKTSEYQSIEHIVVKREVFSEKKMRFEIDYYDYHRVRWDWATNPKMQFIWKTNLLGGGRLFNLIYRLSLLRSLKDFIKSNSWHNQRGYEKGNKFELSHQDQIIDIEANGQAVIKYDTSIKSNNLKDDILYKPPFLVMRQIIGVNHAHLPFVFVPKQNSLTSKNQLYYSRNFVGISTLESEESKLESLVKLFNPKGDYLNAQLFALAISSNCMVLHETAIRQRDILAIPFPEDEKYLKLSESEKIIQNDVLRFYVHLGKSLDKSGRVLHESITEPELQAFGETYCDTLNEIYAKNGRSWQVGKVIQTPVFVQYQFGFGKDGGLEYDFDLKEDNYELPLLEDVKSNKGAIHKRIIRHYKHENGYDCVIFIKPQARRYWLKSIALRDADDTFMALKEAGY